MKLDRNENPDGKGKYALIKLRELPLKPTTPREVATGVLQRPEALDFGACGTDSEFFVIRIKDKYAAPALDAYARAAFEDDEEWGLEVMALAEKARHYPKKKRPD